MRKVEDYLGLARHYARQFSGFVNNSGALEHEDLYQVALVALHRACERYDDSRGVNFEYIAAVWMKREMLKLVQECGNTIRVSEKIRKAIQKIDKAIEEDRLEDMIEAGEITYEELNDSRFRTSTLELVTTDDDEDDSFNIYLNCYLTDNDQDRVDSIEELRYYIGRLSIKDQLIIKSAFGIDRSFASRSEIGEMIGSSKDMITHHKKRILKKLKAMIERESSSKVYRAGNKK